jgi:hypothetical protein
MQSLGEEARNTAKFRFWQEERRFKGPAYKDVVQQALFEAGVCAGCPLFFRGEPLDGDAAR